MQKNEQAMNRLLNASTVRIAKCAAIVALLVFASGCTTMDCWYRSDSATGAITTVQETGDAVTVDIVVTHSDAVNELEYYEGNEVAMVVEASGTTTRINNTASDYTGNTYIEALNNSTVIGKHTGEVGCSV